MARIRFLPDEVEVAALADETLLQASVRAGIPHTHACGGNATPRSSSVPKMFATRV